MSNVVNQIACDEVCFLGAGLSARIGAILARQTGLRPLVLEEAPSFGQFALQLSTGPISPIPIFPLTDGFLSARLGFANGRGENVEVHRTAVSKCNWNSVDIRDDSLGAFLLRRHHSPDEALVLSIKQWGSKVWREPLLQIQYKIIRHYLGGHVNTRCGFHAGLSPYHRLAQAATEGLLHIGTLQCVDLKKRAVVGSKQTVHFRKLVSTIPLPRLLLLCNCAYGGFGEAAPAYFQYYRHTAALQENHLLYDCDPDSPILKVFSPTCNVLMVQVADRGRQPSTYEVSQRLPVLFPGLSGLFFERELRIPAAYPLDFVDQTGSRRGFLREMDILTFGRLGDWEYRDLHELDWSGMLSFIRSGSCILG